MTHTFTFPRTFEVGPIYLEATVEAEYEPATESSGASVLIVTIEAQEPVIEVEMAGMWSPLIKWLIDIHRESLEAEGMTHAIRQGLNRYDYRMPRRMKMVEGAR